MAKKTSPNPIVDLNDDWGNDARVNLPYSGTAVEEVIKRYLLGHEQNKFGGLLAVTDENAVTTVMLFASNNDAEKYQEDPDNNKFLILRSFAIQGAGEAQEFTMAAKIVKAPSVVQVAEDENVVTFSYNSYWGTDTSDLDAQPGSATLTVNNVVVETLALQSGNEYSFDIGKYITQETNKVVMKVSNSHGKSRTWEYSIEAKTLTISFPESYLNSQYTAKTPGWELPVLVGGVGGKVHIKVDDGVLEYDGDVNGGTQRSFAIDSSGKLESGTHTIEVWCVDPNYGLRTNVIKTSYIVESSRMGIAIAANAPEQATMYESTSIPYYFYAPSDAVGSEVEVTVKVADTSGLEISNRAQKVIVNNDHSSGRQEAVVQIMEASYINKDVTVTVSIGKGSGMISAEHKLHINSADITLNYASECKVYYNMAEKTNSDVDVANNAMSSTYNGRQTSRLVRSDNFVLKDTNGCAGAVNGFLVTPGHYLTLKDWLPFAEDFGANGTHSGKSIEMEFEAGVSADINQPIVSCIDSRCGFEIYPNRIEVKYAASDERVITYFPDEERIRFSLVLNGITTECVLDDGNGNVERTNRNLGFIYVNGVMVRIFDYAESSWQQQTPKEIVFGSEESSVIPYTFRGYDKALTMKEVIDNFSYDTPLLADKKAIAKRNNILQSDGKTVDLNKVIEALPNTPRITWWMEELPPNKSTAKECKSTEFENPEWVPEMGHACAPFSATSHEMKGDGTSSNAYPLPYKNWAEKLKDWNGGSNGIITLHLESEDKLVKKYSITYGLEDKETKFVHKVNFASSEGIFNILAMNMYQTITLNSYRELDGLLTPQQQSQLDAGEDITFRKSLSGFPEIGFRKYTKNGQLVTEFLSIYNFINNKKTGSMYGLKEDYKINQLWEIDENVNFFNTPMTEHTADGDSFTESNGVRKSSPFYYSRFPDVSPTNKTDGEANDLGMVKNAAQVAQANDEIKVLRMIHNWIVSVNPNVAQRYFAQYGTYRPFSISEDGFTSKIYAGTEYTHDTPAYRRQKFIAESENWVNIPDCVFYFIFCTYILGMDSMDKNMSLFLDIVMDFYDPDPTVRANAKVRLRIMLRDTDTSGMFNNSGILLYKYWHEWNDTYNPTTGETGQITGESYDPESRTFSVETNVPGSAPVFNGRLSGLWDVISTAIPSTIQSTYAIMRQNGLNFNTFMTMYRKFWSYWCEALYNVDGLGYANTGRFNMAYGDKLMVSTYFYKMRERYMDSKYGYAVNAYQVTLRLSSVPTGIWMKHYTPIYASFNYGGNVATTARSIVVGEPAFLPCSASSFNDATCYINDADMVTEIGTYNDLSDGTKQMNGWEGMQNFCFTGGFSRFKRLKRFIWRNTAAKPNTMQTLAVSMDGGIEFNNLTMLRELVMTYCTQWAGNPVIGSDIIETIDFTGTPIVGIGLPETETLRLLHLPATLRELVIHNCPNLDDFTIAGVNNLEIIDIDNTPIDAFELVQRIYDRHIAGDEVALHKIVLKNIDVALSDNGFEMLMWIAKLDDASITGKITLPNSVMLTFEQKEILCKRFGNIDSDDNPLRIVYRYVINASLEVSPFCDGVADTILQPGQYQFRCIPHVSGNPVDNANYISKVEWQFDDRNNAYGFIDQGGLLTIHTLGGPNTRVKLSVHATLINGTILSDELDLLLNNKEVALGDYVYADGSYSATNIPVKTKIGILFLNENGLKEIVAMRDIASDMWGLYSGNVTGVTLEDGTSAYDTHLTNIGSAGASYAKDTDTSYWDKDTESFKALSNGTCAGEFTFTPQVDTTIVLPGEKVLFEVGKQYPAGKRNTIVLINWRNRVLSAAGFEVPVAKDGKSESTVLTECINAAIASANNNNNYRQYYYPAASRCYAYEPTIKAHETLAEKFKAHQWWLPSGGELSRIMFYWLRNDTTGMGKYDAFRAAKTASIISFQAASYWSSTENSATSAWGVYGSYGHVLNGYNKYNSSVVRAVCAF